MMYFNEFYKDKSLLGNTKNNANSLILINNSVPLQCQKTFKKAFYDGKFNQSSS